MVYPKARKKSVKPIASTYEPLETSVISKILRQGNTAIDLGAHAGHYTILFSKIVGEQGKVFSFEPAPSNFITLRERVRLSALNNVTLEQKAVSNKTGSLKLYLDRVNPGDHRIYDSHDGRQAIDIEAVSLDDYFLTYPSKIDFIKMDIQGSEPAAIQGMSTLLKKNTSLQIATEFWPFGLKTFGVEPIDYLKILLEYGFTLSNINETTKNLEPVTDLATLVQRYPSESDLYTNLLATR